LTIVCGCLAELGAGVGGATRSLFGVTGAFPVIAGAAEGSILTIHNQEDAGENEFLATGKGEFLALYAALGLDVSFFRGRASEAWRAGWNTSTRSSP